MLDFHFQTRARWHLLHLELWQIHASVFVWLTGHRSESCKQVSRLQQLRGLGSYPLPQPSWASSALSWLVKVSNHTPVSVAKYQGGRGVNSVWGKRIESSRVRTSNTCPVTQYPPAREPPLAYVVLLSRSTCCSQSSAALQAVQTVAKPVPGPKGHHFWEDK